MREQIVAALEPRPEVLEAYLFGSQARGQARPTSDVDVAVYLDPALTPSSPFGAAADIAADLIGALGRNDVDLVILNDAPPLLYHRVLRDGERLLSRDLEQSSQPVARGKNAHPVGVRRSFFPGSGRPLFARSAVTLVAGLRL